MNVIWCGWIHSLNQWICSKLSSVDTSTCNFFFSNSSPKKNHSSVGLSPIASFVQKDAKNSFILSSMSVSIYFHLPKNMLFFFSLIWITHPLLKEWSLPNTSRVVQHYYFTYTVSVHFRMTSFSRGCFLERPFCVCLKYCKGGILNPVWIHASPLCRLRVSQKCPKALVHHLEKS